MHIPQLHTPVARVSEKVSTQCGGRGEVHRIGSGRDIVVGEQGPAAEFKIGDDASAGSKVPLQVQRIETRSEGCVGRLEYHEHRYRIQRVFESSLEKCRPVRTGQDPSITEPYVPHSGIRSSARDGVTAAGPELYLVPAVLDSGLRPRERSAEQQD